MKTLRDYVRKQGGRKAAAERLGIKIGTLDSFLYGGRQPSVETARAMIRASEGALTWEALYGDPTEAAA